MIQNSNNCNNDFNGNRKSVYGNRLWIKKISKDERKKPKLKRNSGDAEKDVVVRRCNNCLRVYKGNDRFCPWCGHDNGKTHKQIEADEKAELERIQEIDRKNKRIEVGMAKDFPALVRLGRERGYKNPAYFAMMVIKGREKKKGIKKLWNIIYLTPILDIK